MDQIKTARLLSWAVRVFAAVALVSGAYWLANWLNGAAGAWSASGYVILKTNMALGQMLAGGALLMLTRASLSRWAATLVKLLSCAVLLIGATTLCEHVLNIDLGIDQFLAKESPGAALTSSPNRMGLPGSTSLALLGAGLLVSSSRRPLAHYFGLSVLFVCLVPLLEFLYGIDELHHLSPMTGMAWQSVVVLGGLGLGLILSDAQAGPIALLQRRDPGGNLFRQWLPFVVLVPLVLGYLAARGQRLQLYGSEFGTGALVLLLVVIFTGLLWRTAESLSMAARARGLAEADARRLTEQRRLALDAARLGWWQFDPAADTAVGDERFREIFGISAETKANRDVLARIHPEDVARVRATAEAALKTADPRPFSLEHRIIRPDGTVRWVQAHAVISAPEPGTQRGIGLIGTVQDITERKTIEEVLRESEQRYRLLFDRNPDGVFVVDRTGRFTVLNPACEVISGYSAAELLQKTFMDLCAPDQLAKTAEHFAANLKDRAYAQLETALIRKDGTRVDLWITGEPIVHDDQVVAVHCTARDITERKRALTTLRENEEQFRTLADSIPHLAWWADREGNINWYNKRWYDYTGTTPEQMLGWGWQSVHDPAILSHVLEQWRASIASGQPFEMEIPLRAADGRYRWFLTRVIPLRDAEGNVLRWFGTNTDVSETREAREVLTRSKQELERLVSERTAKLQELVGELEHFSYSITHDMRAPLRAMKGFAEVVNELSTGAQPELRQFVRRIMTAADRMDSLIRDALSYSRAVRQELPLEPVDPGALLRGMLDSYPELQPSKARIELRGELPMVMGNEAGLTQCFSNLLGNAVKFVRPGQMPEVRIWSEPRDGWLRIWVEDNGIGISKLMLPRIFEMFSRGHNTYEGTGIGLALVRKVVQRMGGRLGVESEEGKGSRFWLELKLWQKPPATP